MNDQLNLIIAKHLRTYLAEADESTLAILRTIDDEHLLRISRNAESARSTVIRAGGDEQAGTNAFAKALLNELIRFQRDGHVNVEAIRGDVLHQLHQRMSDLELDVDEETLRRFVNRTFNKQRRLPKFRRLCDETAMRINLKTIVNDAAQRIGITNLRRFEETDTFDELIELANERLQLYVYQACVDKGLGT